MNTISGKEAVDTGGVSLDFFLRICAIILLHLQVQLQK